MADYETNPILWAWKQLPPEAKKAYGSLGAFIAEMSPGASIRDAVDESGKIMTGLLRGEGWTAAGGGAGLLTAMAGVVPGSRAAAKLTKEAAEKAAKELAAKKAAMEKATIPKPGETVTGLGGEKFKVLTEEEAKARLQTPEVKKAVKEEVAAAKAGETGRFPQLADRYPEVSPPVFTWDKNNEKYYLARGTSPEAHIFNQARAVHAADVNAGNFDPLFDPAKRYDVKGSYGKFIDTDTARMKTQKSIDQYEKEARDPAALKRLVDARDRGELLPGSNDWYLVGQLEAPFLKQYGMVEGPKRFREQFAEAMATTTAGNDPTANFLFGSYGNYIKGQGHTAMPASWNTPPPIGGQYMASNLAEFDKVRMQGEPIGLGNPKRLDFTQAFLGDKNAMTMDKQMMTGMYNRAVPPPGAYGHFSAAARDVARKEGVDPRAYQDVPWHGFKLATEPDLKPQPMVQNVNQSMERTARLTGETPEAAYLRWMKKYGPVYGIGGLAVPGLLDFREERQY